MGSSVYNLYEAKTVLSKLVDLAAAGDEVIIAKAGKPVAKLVPYATPTTGRKPGGWSGRVSIAGDFDAPLPQGVEDSFSGG